MDLAVTTSQLYEPIEYKNISASRYPKIIIESFKVKHFVLQILSTREIEVLLPNNHSMSGWSIHSLKDLQHLNPSNISDSIAIYR